MPTNDTLVVNRWVDHIAERIWRDGYQYKKAGILLQGLMPANQLQPSLPGLGEAVDPARTRLMQIGCATDTSTPG